MKHDRQRDIRSNAIFLAMMLPVFAAAAVAQEPDMEYEHLRMKESRRYRLRAETMAAERLSGTGIDVIYYELDLQVTATRGTLTGRVTTEATVAGAPATAITVDLSRSITVDSVRIAGAPVAHSHPGDILAVTLPRTYAAGERLSWTVFYHGTPGSTGFGSYTDSIRSNGTRWVFTLSEPYGARDWWPCVDHPTDKADSVEVRITCPTGLCGVSNGLLQDTSQNVDGTTSFRWKHRFPVASYLISVNVGSYVTFSDWYSYGPTDSLRIVNYVQPDLMTRNPNARTSAARVPRMLAVFEELFGPYPFRSEGYGHVEFGWNGGMEHQTMTSLGVFAFSEGTIAHELAHQWFGDLITCRTWPDLWLNEGFATYSDMLFRERQYGRNTFVQAMMARAGSARSASGALRVQDTTSVGNLFASSRVYNKGAWVLHMLRRVLGDTSFFAAIRSYAADPALRFGTASTTDLRASIEATTGNDLVYFFNQWVLGERYPAYTYAMSSAAQGPQSVATVRVQQTTGTTNPRWFRMPIDLRFMGNTIDTMVTVWNDTTDQTWQFTLAGTPDSVVLDPDNWILKTAQRVPMAGLTDAVIPNTVQLSANFPNPFNGTTWIRVGLPERSHVLLEVFDLSGRRVSSLVDRAMERGTLDIPWTAEGASGAYVFRVVATSGRGESVVARKVVLLR